jgi:hypothetical protein
MASFRFTPRRKSIMHEMFHTEDCGLSLICRCCRGPTGERCLARADRLYVQRDLWPSAMKQRGESDPKKRARGTFSGILSFSIFRWFRSAG